MLDRLHRVIDDASPAAIAVSGGVDSMTLAFIAHQRNPDTITMFHAVSPAVPKAATLRVETYAKQENWDLRLLNAGEFEDAEYLANPVNRCFFCKQNLYASLRSKTTKQILSGTNLDDLGDYRPGLEAAKAQNVRHPFVEAGINKAGIRKLAAALGLPDLAELPSAPCLSSRIETGLRIAKPNLLAIDAVETMLRERLNVATVRCRIRKEAIVIELEPESLAKELSGSETEAEIARLIRAAEHENKPILFEPYKRGSAFLHKTAQVRRSPP